MKTKYYCVLLVFAKNQNISPVVGFYQGLSEDEAIKNALIEESNINLLIEGFKVEVSKALILSSIICPRNSESAFTYTWPENSNKINYLTINMDECRDDFKADLKELLSKYWTIDLDKL